MSARRSLSCDARQLTWLLVDSEGDAEMWGVVCFGPFGTNCDRVGALCAASALGWVCARARAVSGRAGVRNEWAAGVGAPPKNLVLRGPLRWTTERTSSWARCMGARTRRQALGHSAAHSIVVERKHALNKLLDATRSEPRDLVWLY